MSEYLKYMDQKRIKEDLLREECKRKNMIACHRCGRPAIPRGISHSGPIVCIRCRYEGMRPRT